MNGQRWCHACSKAENFDGNWFEVWVDGNGRCVITPVSDPAEYHNEFHGDIFACGQLTALVLVERYLHTKTFDLPPAPLDYTPAQLAYELNSNTDCH